MYSLFSPVTSSVTTRAYSPGANGSAGTTDQFPFLSITVDPIDAPEFTVSTADITCFDAGNTGAITFNVTATNGNTLEYSIDGGTTFSNSPVFTGLAAGDYDVVVQYSIGGSVCGTSPQTVTILTNDAISGTADLTANYTCSTPGTITVTSVNGGDAPYTYSIDGVNFQGSNVFTGLTSGTYVVTIQDANLCTAITNVVVIDPLDPPTDMTFDNTPITCPSNTSDVTITNVTGGTTPLEYQIIAPAAYATGYQTSNVFAGLVPGTYTFEVRDANDCTYAETFTIDPIPTPTVSVVLTEGIDCTATPDAVITGTITGTAPFTYEVSINGAAYTSFSASGNSFTYTTATVGTYQFQITDGSVFCAACDGIRYL